MTQPTNTPQEGKEDYNIEQSINEIEEWLGGNYLPDDHDSMALTRLLRYHLVRAEDYGAGIYNADGYPTVLTNGIRSIVSERIKEDTDRINLAVSVAMDILALVYPTAIRKEMDKLTPNG